jgi:lipid A 3-O-deacylase
MKKLKLTLLAAAGAALALPARAIDLRPEWVYLQGGLAEHRMAAATVGLAWPWSWRSTLGNAEVTAQTEAYASAWSAPGIGGGRQSLAQLGLVPVFRFRLEQGRSDWFLEAGIGVTWMSKRLHTPDKQMSTTGNFHDLLGLGRSFGADRSRELGLRYVHFSNAGIKRPNPGLNVLQLRYGWKF